MLSTPATFAEYSTLGALAIAVYLVAVFVLLVMDNREPVSALAWLLLMTVFPLVGLVLYFFFGRNWRAAVNSDWSDSLQRVVLPIMRPTYERYGALQTRLKARTLGTLVDDIIISIEVQNSAFPLPVRDYDLLNTGAEFFDRMKSDMRAATHSIHHQYFIWERDDLTAELTQIMLERLSAGVEVRIIYDWLGSLPYGKSELRELKAAGAQVYSDLRHLSSVNYRNHRKITIIDAEIGYTGGFNVGQEYIDGGSRYPLWRDTGIRITGPGVAELQKWFSTRWYRLADEVLLASEYLPADAPDLAGGDPLMIQVVGQGADDPWMSARRTHMVAIASAEKTVRIQSPYFVPDAGIYDTMINSALGGVDVQFMMTGLYDHLSAFESAKTYWAELLRAGGRVFLYEDGFFHAKTIAVDTAACAIGTMNIDRRSLALQKEMMTWVYSAEHTRELEDVFEADKARCREVTLAEIEAYSFWAKLRQRSFRLISNVL